MSTTLAAVVTFLRSAVTYGLILLPSVVCLEAVVVTTRLTGVIQADGGTMATTRSSRRRQR